MELTTWCGTDPVTRLGYRRELAAAGFDTIDESFVEYADVLTFDQLVGSVYSAMSADRLPRGGHRRAFERRLRQTLGGAPEAFTEQVRVAVLVGTWS